MYIGYIQGYKDIWILFLMHLELLIAKFIERRIYDAGVYRTSDKQKCKLVVKFKSFDTDL